MCRIVIGDDQLVTRLPGGGLAIVDGDRWIAPVADELQNALSVDLLHRLGGVDPAEATGPESVSVRLNVERFESSPNRYALIEASWDLELKEAGKGLIVDEIGIRAWSQLRAAPSHLTAVRAQGHEPQIETSHDELVCGQSRLVSPKIPREDNLSVFGVCRNYDGGSGNAFNASCTARRSCGACAMAMS